MRLGSSRNLPGYRKVPVYICSFLAMNRFLVILLLNACHAYGAPVTLPEKALADDCGEACGADVSLMQSSAMMTGLHITSSTV